MARQRRPPLSSPIPLAYSSPFIGHTSLPTVRRGYYNAFPELNDLARDGTRSALPRRAKYCLPLDGELIPSAEEIGASDLDEEVLERLDAETIDLLRTVFAEDPHVTMPVPKAQAQLKVFDLETIFELGHKRLTPAPAKRWFRTHMIAPFYTTLERALVEEDTLAIPIIPDPSGTQVEREWLHIREWVRAERPIDEAASLLIAVILADVDDIYHLERAWVAQQRAEIDGFEGVYGPLRERYRREECEDRRQLAEGLVADVTAQLSLSFSAEVLGLSIDQLEHESRASSYGLSFPPILHSCPSQSLRINAAALSGTTTRPSIPEAVQCLLARDAVQHGQHRSYTSAYATWNDYADFNLDGDDDGAYVSGSVNRAMFQAISGGITQADGASIDDATREAVARYSIFWEAIRQQVCTGVGLRCPFWDGASCCEFQPLLQRIRSATAPRPSSRWARHWQPPPCLA